MLEALAEDSPAARALEGDAGPGVYRLLFRALASDPGEVRRFYEDTIGPLVGHDEQYRGDLLPTLEAYLEHDFNMNATAKAIYAHRHTVAYRLERVRELTGLDPTATEDRERLGLGLKALRIVQSRTGKPVRPGFCASDPAMIQAQGGGRGFAARSKPGSWTPASRFKLGP